MFGKDKVKGHNRVVKGKSGFKVIRVKDFLRREDDNKKRNLAIGAGVVLGAGGIALLLRKKGVKVDSLLKKSTKFTPKYPKYPKNATVIPKKVAQDIKPSISNNASTNNGFSKTDLEKYKKPVVEPRPIVNIQPKKTSIPKTDTVVTVKKDFDPLPDPWDTPIPKPKMRSAKLLVKKPTSQNRLRRKDNIPDPWESPIKYNLKKESSELLVKKEGVKLLSPAKLKTRKNLLRPKSVRNKLEESVVNMRNTQKNYDNLPLDMKVTVQIEKALTRPIRSSNIGRPPDTKGLKVILDEGNKTPIEQVISKAKRKVKNRLERESEIVKKKQLDDVISSPSRRAFLKKVTPKLDKDTTLTKIGDIIEPKSSMGKIIRRMNNLAKDPEVERLGIKVRDDEWEKALRTIAGRREMMLRTKNGLSSAAESLVYTRVVKPKIIKSLMGELNSGRLSETNPKGYAQRLKRIEENLADLFKKEGVNYKRIGRRELMTRTARIMEPEINDTARKMKDFATDPATLTEVFYGNPELSAGLKMAGIKDKNMIKAIRLLMFLGAGPG